MYTPWGESQTVEVIAPGISWVTTASHGGFVITHERQVELEHRLNTLVYDQSIESYGTGGSRFVAYEEDAALYYGKTVQSVMDLPLDKWEKLRTKYFKDIQRDKERTSK